MRSPIRLPHDQGEALPVYQPHGPREECGVIGIWAPGQPVAHLAYVGLHALQHRGQESAGIAVSDGGQLSLHKRLGLVSGVFDPETLLRLEGGDDGPGSKIKEAFRPRSYWEFDLKKGTKSLLIRGKIALGNIDFDANGNPAGVFKDAAMGYINKVIPAPSWEERLEGAQAATDHAAAMGITSVQDMSAGRDVGSRQCWEMPAQSSAR